MPEQPIARVAPFQRYYLLIDGTHAVDSIEYGRALEEMFGWRNLLVEFLEPDPNPPKGKADRLIDPNHPYLPICTFDVPGRRRPIAVVSPGGRHGRGLDAFWRAYKGETPEEQAENGMVEWNDSKFAFSGRTWGRHTAAQRSAMFMYELMLTPAIERVRQDGRLRAQLRHGTVVGSRNPEGVDIHAELLFVSSHGWLAGFMRGDNLAADPLAEPPDARYAFASTYYFMVGKAAQEARYFAGPKWIIMAQCSTVNSATWALWAELMARSLPPVRGLLAYEEVSPSAHASVPVARAFFAALKAGKSFLQAWRQANTGLKWSAIVHRDAVDDRMQDWEKLKPLGEAVVAEDRGSYLGFGANFRGGTEITNQPPPFRMELHSSLPVTAGDPRENIPSSPDEWYELNAAEAHRARSSMSPQAWVRMTVRPPAGDALRRIAVQWVHIRESHTLQPPLAAMFSHFFAARETEFRCTPTGRPQRLVVEPQGEPVDEIVLLFLPVDAARLVKAGLEEHHAWVFPKVDVELVSGKRLAYRFYTQGLRF